GPIIGITLVLMSVFLPAAFLPGLTGRMYAQFALVIAATALLSAINAATLKPTQSAMWLRRAVPPEGRNVFYRAFHRVYDRIERWYAGLIAGMVARSALMAAVALALIAATGYWFSRVPTGFLPIEDQGLHDRARAIARWRLARAHAADLGQGVRNRAQNAGRRARGQHRRGVGARQQRDAVERRRVLYHTQGLERARQRRRPDVAVQQPQRRARRHPGSGYPGHAAAADPGRRQRRRLHHAGRAARRQLRHGQAAERHQRDRCQRQDAVGAAAGAGLVPLQRSAIPARGRPGEDRGAPGSPRPGVRRARGLSRIDLRQPVQPIRPGVPGLCAGRLAVPP